MNITENFTLEEFMHSDTAIAKGIKNDPGSRVQNCYNHYGMLSASLSPLIQATDAQS